MSEALTQPIAGVNKLAFKWIIIWEKFPKNRLWGRVSSCQKDKPLRVNQLTKTKKKFILNTIHQGTLTLFPDTKIQP